MRIYMDHCATTPMYDEVIESMTVVMKEYYGNPSSLHGLGLQAEKLVVKARETVAEAIGVKSSEIVFTSGGTESNNLAVIGAARQSRERGKHMIVSSLEHASVFESAKRLQEEGWDIVTADKSSGRIEATDTTRWFGFKDDVVVRLTPWGAGTRVDVRSVSRIGRSDIGTNARRIRQYLDQLQSN